MVILSGLSMAQEDHHSLEEKFDAAVSVIRSLPDEGPFQPSDSMMLRFYGSYNQATLGPCDAPRPTGFWDSAGKAKWDAWSALGTMTKEEAMKNYIEDIQLILETIPVSEEVSDLVQKLGDFYTEVDGDGEEAEEEEEDRRAFTRPFLQHTGYGDLWEEIQNLQEEHRDSLSSEEEKEEGSTGSSENERKEESSDKNEEEEEEEEAFWNEEEDMEDEEEEEEEEEGDRDEDAPPKNRRPTDSQDQEFCDSMEHLAMEEGASRPNILCPGPGAASLGQKDLCSENSTSLSGAVDPALGVQSRPKEGNNAGRRSSSFSRGSKRSRSPRVSCQRRVNGDAVCCGVSQRHHPVRGNANQQIAEALLSLQRDMAAVLRRLHALEALTQSRTPFPRKEESPLLVTKLLRPSWWPFDLCPLSVFTALWPLAAHWLVQVYLQQKRRKNP